MLTKFKTELHENQVSISFLKFHLIILLLNCIKRNL